MQYIVVLAALAGCYSPGFRDCEVACGGGDCPSGLTCELGFCRVVGATQSCSEVLGDAGLEVDADPSVDRDGDSVPDTSDNCPDVANGDQHDEDLDLLGDGCDPCPHLTPAPGASSAADADGDGVGDACDPSPATDGDRILLFESFATPDMQPVGSSTKGAVFSFANDTALTAPTVSETAKLWWDVLEAGRPYLIMTRIHVGAIAASNVATGAGGFEVEDASGAGVACTRGVLQNAPSQMIVMSNADSMDAVGNSASAQDISQRMAEITVRQTSFGYECFSDGTSLGNNVATSTIATGVGVYARGVNVAFDYVLVIDSPSPGMQ